MTTFSTRVTFDHVRNTEAGFAAANPVLGYGVIGLETDTGRAKIGDGVTAWNALGYFTGEIGWAGITSKPSTFPPSQHGHTIAEVSGLQASLDGKQVAGSYAASVHNHTAAQITDFAAAVVAAAPPTTDASALTSGTLDAARLPGSVVLTTDARLSDARTPTGHSHGNINNFGQLASGTIASGSVAGPVVFDVLAGTVGRGAFGTSAGTFCQGNDSRLSDARTPLAHTQAWTTITSTPTSLSGYGITDAVASSDARLTDARTPLAHNQAWSTITSTPTTLAGYGITDAAALSHTHSAQDIQSGVIAPARLAATGNPSNSTFLRGDNVWATVVQTVIDGGSASTVAGSIDGGSATTA